MGKFVRLCAVGLGILVVLGPVVPSGAQSFLVNDEDIGRFSAYP